MARPLWLVCLLGLGCHVTDAKAPPRQTAQAKLAPTPAPTPPDSTPTKVETQRPPKTQAGPSDLATAAMFLDKGDDLAACYHMGRFVEQHPEHGNAHFYLAELLCKLGKAPAARVHFEQAAAAAREARPVDRKHLIHLHSRLLAIAEAEEDDFRAHLHRGIGLLLLAQGRAKLPDPEGDLPVEGLLCKAAGELTLAHGVKPGEARPCWYLYVVWRQLAQPQQAGKWLALAQDTAHFSPLTPAEQRGLHLAAGAVASARHP